MVNEGCGMRIPVKYGRDDLLRPSSRASAKLALRRGASGVEAFDLEQSVPGKELLR